MKRPRATRFYRRNRPPSAAHLSAQSVLDALPTPSVLLDSQGAILAVNQAWERFGALNGGGTDSMVGVNYLNVCDSATGPDAESAHGVAGKLRGLLSGEIEHFAYEYPCPTVDGQRWYVVHGSCFSSAEARRVLLRHEDITAHRQIERSLRASQQRYAMVWAAINDALALSDPEGIVLDANRAYYQLYGGTPAEVIGASFARIFPPEIRAVAEQQYRETFATQPEGMLFETEVIDAAGTTHIVESRIDFLTDDGQRIAMLSVIRDITERKQAAAALQERQRLESIGLLAGGIAHDFNNLLTTVQGYTELALARLAPGQPAHADIQQALIGIRHISDLTTQLLAYAGQGAPLILSLNLNTVIGEVSGLVRVPARRLGGIVYELAPELPAVEGDVGQIRQVVLNLITNATEAVAERPGSVTVSTGVADLTAAELRTMHNGEGLKPGRYVMLSVADTGHGMDPATEARIFDPFFSTRAFGRGMGLAVVHGVIRRHSAAVSIESEVGRGTTIRVYFPALAAAAVIPPEPEQEAEVRERRGMCLVIDDEPAVLRVSRRMLEHLGYTVVQAEDGAAGLDLLSAHGDQVVVALVDLTMPHMMGDAVLRAIKQRRPNLWVVLMSGYSTAELAEGGSEYAPDAYLQKPFTLDALRGALAGQPA